jgi:hypothetical protein
MPEDARLPPFGPDLSPFMNQALPGHESFQTGNPLKVDTRAINGRVRASLEETHP